VTNHVKRILSSIVFVILILGPLFLSHKIAFTVYALLGAFTLNELLNLHLKAKGSPQRALSLLSYALLVLICYQWLFQSSESVYIFFLAYVTLVLVIIVREVFRTNPLPFDGISSTVLAPIFVSSSFLGISYFFVWRDDIPQLWITISTFGIIWINDSAAYLLGRKIGRTKLFERLSPNKTVEGSLSGAFFGLIAAVCLSQVAGMPNLAVMAGFGLSLIIGGSLGDLLESRLKRKAGLKDSGKFLPGHGGFFDRFDAMMLAIPIAILYFEIFYPKN
jgi:phosphatidate cytidylyltransferase